MAAAPSNVFTASNGASMSKADAQQYFANAGGNYAGVAADAAKYGLTANDLAGLYNFATGSNVSGGQVGGYISQNLGGSASINPTTQAITSTVPTTPTIASGDTLSIYNYPTSPNSINNTSWGMNPQTTTNYLDWIKQLGVKADGSNAANADQYGLQFAQGTLSSLKQAGLNTSGLTVSDLAAINEMATNYPEGNNLARAYNDVMSAKAQYGNLGGAVLANQFGAVDLNKAIQERNDQIYKMAVSQVPQGKSGVQNIVNMMNANGLSPSDMDKILNIAPGSTQSTLSQYGLSYSGPAYSVGQYNNEGTAITSILDQTGNPVGWGREWGGKLVSLGGVDNGRQAIYDSQTGQVLGQSVYDTATGNTFLVKPGETLDQVKAAIRQTEQSGGAAYRTSQGWLYYEQPSAGGSSQAGGGIIQTAPAKPSQNITPNTGANSLIGSSSGYGSMSGGTGNMIPGASTSAPSFTARTITPQETVRQQLNDLLNENGPYIQGARNRSLETMNGRGLINSSMAADAAETAAINAAAPIAAQDASTYAASGLSAQNANQDVGLTGYKSALDLYNNSSLSAQNFQQQLGLNQQQYGFNSSLSAQGAAQTAAENARQAQYTLDLNRYLQEMGAADTAMKVDSQNKSAFASSVGGIIQQYQNAYANIQMQPDSQLSPEAKKTAIDQLNMQFKPLVDAVSTIYGYNVDWSNWDTAPATSPATAISTAAPPTGGGLISTALGSETVQ